MVIAFILLIYFSIPSFGNSHGECYVTYESAGFNGKEKFTVFVQNRSNPGYYFGFEIAHELDTSDLVFSNQYRLQKGPVYQLQDTEMVPTGLTALAGGESECVYRALDAIDFTGGWHGDEQLTEVNFYIDGVRLTKAELSGDFYLKPCMEFSYIQKSNMHQTRKESDTTGSNHKIEAIHYKKSIFRNSGYETHNRLDWRSRSTIVIAYMSISCIATDIGEFCQSDKSEICKLDRSSDHKLSEANNNIHIWNETNGSSARIKSEFNINNDSAIQFIWDVSNYNKYYRNLVSDDPVTVNEGDMWKSVTQVEFLMK